MSNKIGIVMAGYIDENHKLLTRSEVNERIASIQKENETLKRALKKYEEMRCFYGNNTNWCQLIDGQYNLGKIWVYTDYENRFLDNSITTENGKKARELLNDSDVIEAMEMIKDEKK